jgi:hypothetical protein
MVSTGSLSSKIGYMIAENAIEAEEVQKKASRSAHLQGQVQLELRNAQREQANDLQAAISTVNTIASAVKAGEAVVNVGSAVDTAKQESTTRTNLNTGLDSAGSGGSGSLDSLKSVQLGEGQTVGQRFNDQQLGVLTSGQPVTQSQADLEAMGFSKNEAKELRRVGADGLSHDEAVDFMWQHRATDSQQHSSQQRDKIKEGVIKFVQDAFKYGAQDGIKHSKENAKKAGDESKTLNELADDIRDLSSKHNSNLGDIQLEGIQQKGDNNSQTGRRRAK